MGNKANWEGVRFTDDNAVEADGGFVGDVTGNITGNITGTLTGNVVGNLSGDSVEVDSIFTAQATSEVFFIAGSLPTSDPSNAGQAWIDSTAGYAIKVSQG
jgi:hypothetical protein